MLTTSRREVSIDNKYDNVLNKTDAESNILLAERENVAEIPASQIALKIFGGKEYKEEAYASSDVSNPDLLPSQRTIETAKETPQRGLLSDSLKYRASASVIAKTRVKIVVAAYIAVILALAIFVAFSAASAAANFANVTALSQERAEQIALMGELEAELGTIDLQELLSAAPELGYSNANSDNTVTYTMPRMRSEQSFNVQSNWFDKLCRFISETFGG